MKTLERRMAADCKARASSLQLCILNNRVESSYRLFKFPGYFFVGKSDPWKHHAASLLMSLTVYSIFVLERKATMGYECCSISVSIDERLDKIMAEFRGQKSYMKGRSFLPKSEVGSQKVHSQTSLSALLVVICADIPVRGTYSKSSFISRKASFKVAC